MAALRTLVCLTAALLGAAGVGPALAADTPAERRVALVIGNGAYRAGALANPVNDARAMAATLKSLGFEVTAKENLDLAGMVEAVRALYLKSKDYDVRLFYYAGHGVQIKGRNYLVPVGVQAIAEEDVGSRTLDLNELLERLGSVRPGLNLVVLDACRSNPFLGPTMLTADGRAIKLRGMSGARPGLAQVEAAQGTLVAYATAPGQVAVDGNQGANGLYTHHLLNFMTVPGLPVETLFKRVRNAVTRDTRGEQIPWESSSMVGEFCFRHVAGGGCLANGESRAFEPGAGSASGTDP